MKHPSFLLFKGLGKLNFHSQRHCENCSIFTSVHSCSCNRHLLIDGLVMDFLAQLRAIFPVPLRIQIRLYQAAPMIFPHHLFHFYNKTKGENFLND